MKWYSRPARTRLRLVRVLATATLLHGCIRHVPEPPPPTAMPGDDLGALVIPRAREGVLEPGESVTHPINFEGRKPASVTLTGNGLPVLALHVFDADNRLVASDTRPEDGLVVRWEPQRTGTFRVMVQNTGTGRAAYRLRTN